MSKESILAIGKWREKLWKGSKYRRQANRQSEKGNNNLNVLWKQNFGPIDTVIWIPETLNVKKKIFEWMDKVATSKIPTEMLVKALDRYNVYVRCYVWWKRDTPW